MDSRPFEIHEVMRLVREAVATLPKAVMFELADEGYRSLFEQVVGCIISARTREEVTAVVARRLFAAAGTPAAIGSLPVEAIAAILRPATYPEAKAARIRHIARRTVEEFGGALPCDEAVIRSLPGVGPKCANLALGIACGLPRIAVDIHVHRVTNRWGYVATRTPEATMNALEAVLPPQYWVEINRLLVPFGKSLCTGERPHCSRCPVRPFCRQVGVTSRR
jgi:endonuclease-3